MIFQFTWPKVLSGEKTGTSRIVKPGDMELVGGELPAHSEYFTRDNALYVRGPAELVNTLPITRVDRNGRVLYEVGKDYAVQPGRGQKSVGRILITGLERYDVRLITPEQVRAEGFGNDWEFLQVWICMHDKAAHWQFDPQRVDYWINTGKHRELVGWETVQKIIAARPVPKYTAWLIRFELLEVYK